MRNIGGFGNGANGSLDITSNSTEAPIDSTATAGTSGGDTFTASNASFAADQLIFIHQTIGTGVTAWEFNFIESYNHAGSQITTQFPLENSYTSSGNNRAQVRVVPQYSSVNIDSGVTYSAKAWNPTTGVGGLLFFLCSGHTQVDGSISASGKGYLGGASVSSVSGGKQGEGSALAGTVSPSANGGGGGGGRADAASSSGGGGGGFGVAGTDGSPGGGNAGGSGGSTTGAADMTTISFGGGGGSGGAGQAGGSGSSTGGAGGVGGGFIGIFSQSIEITGTIVSNGTNGSNGTSSFGNGSGGGGGGGGGIWLRSSVGVFGSGLINCLPGSGGGVSGGSTGVGGAGGKGRIRIESCSSDVFVTDPSASQVIGGLDWCQSFIHIQDN